MLPNWGVQGPARLAFRQPEIGNWCTKGVIRSDTAVSDPHRPRGAEMALRSLFGGGGGGGNRDRLPHAGAQLPPWSQGRRSGGSLAMSSHRPATVAERTLRDERREATLLRFPKTLRPLAAKLSPSPLLVGGVSLIRALYVVRPSGVGVKDLVDVAVVRQLANELAGQGATLAKARQCLRDMVAEAAERERVSSDRLRQLAELVPAPCKGPEPGEHFGPDVTRWYQDEEDRLKGKNAFYQANWVVRCLLEYEPGLTTAEGGLAWDLFTTLHWQALEGIVAGKSGTPGTAHVRLSCFKALAVWALRKGLLGGHVVDAMHGFTFGSEKAERALSEESLIGIYNAVAMNGFPVHRALLAMIAESGARVESLLGLNDVDVVLTGDNPYITFRSGLKGGSPPPHYLSEEAADVLRWYVINRPPTLDPDRPFLRGSTGNRALYTDMLQDFKRFAHEAGVEFPTRTCFHAFRHRQVTRLLLVDGFAWAEVANIMGFTDIRTLFRYVANSPELQAMMVERMHIGTLSETFVKRYLRLARNRLKEV